MPTRESSLVIASSPEALFQLTQDYSRRLAWDPFLREARLVGGSERVALGSRAWCVSRQGLGMETEYVAFDPPRVVAVRMTRGPALFGCFASSWRFEGLAAGGTRVRIRYHVRARPRWLAWLLDPLLMRAFGRETDARLAGLKRSVESGAVDDPRARS